MALELKKPTEPNDNEEERMDDAFNTEYRNGDIDLNDLPPIKDNGSAPVKSIDNGRVKVIKLILLFIVICGLAAAGYFIYNHAIKEVDITGDLNLTEDEMAKKYDLTFEDDADVATRIPHYSGGKVTARTADGLTCFYINGKQAGWCTDSGTYTFYGVKKGDAEKDAVDHMTFKYDDCFSVLKDGGNYQSDTFYYYNTADNNCFAYTRNNTSNRAAQLIYYNDYKLISQELDFGENDTDN